MQVEHTMMLVLAVVSGLECPHHQHRQSKEFYLPNATNETVINVNEFYRWWILGQNDSTTTSCPAGAVCSLIVKLLVEHQPRRLALRINYALRCESQPWLNGIQCSSKTVSGFAPKWHSSELLCSYNEHWQYYDRKHVWIQAVDLMKQGTLVVEYYQRQPPHNSSDSFFTFRSPFNPITNFTYNSSTEATRSVTGSSESDHNTQTTSSDDLRHKNVQHLKTGSPHAEDYVIPMVIGIGSALLVSVAALVFVSIRAVRRKRAGQVAAKSGVEDDINISAKDFFHNVNSASDPATTEANDTTSLQSGSVNAPMQQTKQPLKVGSYKALHTANVK